MQNIGIDTNKFYKFTATVSLAVLIFCLSFDTIFLEPYNEKATDLNIQKAELASEIGYTLGLIKDLESGILDSTKNGYIEYFYYTNKDTSELIRYYSRLNNNFENQKNIDSLNKLNYQQAKNIFKDLVISNRQKVLETNIKVKQIFIFIIGFISICVFLLSMSRWYLERESIDK
jgi:hypothetical protein